MGSAIDKVIQIAEGEVGYLEKASNSNLDSKTANAGSNNYTKYARDVAPDVQGLPWCSTWCMWVFIKAFGAAEAKKMCNGLSPDCDEVAQNYKDMGRWYKTPKRGDQIVFVRSGDYYHTGLVYKVEGSTVYTIEANTSAGSAVIPNGGAVCKKSYDISNSKIGGYGRPKYPDGEYEDQTDKLNKTRKFYGWVTASTLNVREYAGVEYATTSISPLNRNTKVAVCDTVKASDGSDWYYIKYNGKYGCVSAQYITKTNPSGSKESTKDASEITVDQLLRAAKITMDTARTNGYHYGDSHATPPCSDQTISCDRLIARALFDLGFRDQRQGGETCGTLDSYLNKHGFKRSTSPSDVRKGSILLVTHPSLNYVSHAFICVSYDKSTWVTSRYDAGSNQRIQTVQPLKNVRWDYRKDKLIVYNIPEKKETGKWESCSSTYENGLLRIFADPSADSNVLMRIAYKGKMETDGQTSGNFTHVRCGDVEGWAKTKYIKK